MVYWTYIGVDETTGGRIHSNNVKKLLREKLINKSKIIIETFIKEEENYSHCCWRYDIYLNDGERMWISCMNRKIFDKIYNDVINFNKGV